MAKTSKRGPAHRTPRQKSRPSGSSTQAMAKASGRNPVLWGSVLVALVLIVGTIIFFMQRDDGSTKADDSGDRVIATLKTPDVHSLAIDPDDADHVFFGSHAGIMESRDGGFTWTEGALKGADAMTLAVSPKDSQTLYAAGHDVFLVSRDAGQSWHPVQHDLPGTDIHAFAQNPTATKQLVAFVVGNGVFTSIDGGATWSSLTTQPPGGIPIALAANGELLFAATAGGLSLSRDWGETWEELPAQPASGVISLVAPSGDPNLLYAGTSDGVAKSIDGGKTWTALGPKGIPVLALAATADAQRVLFVSQVGGVYRSDDGGSTWRAPQ